MTVQNVPLEWLEPNPWNPNVMDPEAFEDLKADVIAGDYEPLVASPKNVFYGDPELPSDRYVIVDGEHRWRAAVEADVGYVDVDIRLMTEAEAKSYNYRRNSIRGSMDPVKEGELFDGDVEELGSEEAVAERYGRSRSYVAGRRSLVRLAEPVKQLHRAPKKGFEALKKEELAADIVGSNPTEAYTEQEVTEMVDATWEEQKIVPRGTLTKSHMEAITGLPEESQKQVATKIVEENLTVRDTETVVRLVHEKMARHTRFEEALERAVQKTCPECGALPEDFEKLYTWGDQDQKFNEDRFECSRTRYHDWPYMKRAPSKERQLEEQRKERSKTLSEARLNPRYIRREEEEEALIEGVRPWVLRKIQQLDEIKRVSIMGLRGDKVVAIDFPSSYGAKLFFRIGDSAPDEYFDRFHSIADKRFGFDIEKKIYKSLPFKSKLDLSQAPSPENRAQVHHFLDHIIKTDGDPFLPEDEDIRKDILRTYGETPEEEAEVDG